MRRAIWIVVGLFFGVMFWVAFDATGIQHEPFDFLDRRTLLGLSAWMCAGLAARCFDQSSKKGS